MSTSTVDVESPLSKPVLQRQNAYCVEETSTEKPKVSHADKVRTAALQCIPMIATYVSAQELQDPENWKDIAELLPQSEFKQPFSAEFQIQFRDCLMKKIKPHLSTAAFSVIQNTFYYMPAEALNQIVERFRAFYLSL